MGQSLEQYILATPPPRRLRSTLLHESPTGDTLRRLMVFEIVSLLLAPLPYLLPTAATKWLTDFIFFLDPPGLWVFLWLLGCVAALLYARHLRRRFALAEQGVAVQGRVVSVRSESYTQYIYYSMATLERWIFTVALPIGFEPIQLEFRSEHHQPHTVTPMVAPGDDVTALYLEGKFPASCRLLGLEDLDSRCAVLLRKVPTFSPRAVLGGLALLLGVVGVVLYTITFCEIIDPLWDRLKLPCLIAGVAGMASLAWLRRRYHWQTKAWMVLLLGALLGPVTLVLSGWMVNCWLDFGSPEWRDARILSRGTESLSPQVPLRVGYLNLRFPDGGRAQYSCRASRIDTFGSQVRVRVNQGALGFRWIGDVQPAIKAE